RGRRRRRLSSLRAAAEALHRQRGDDRRRRLLPPRPRRALGHRSQRRLLAAVARAPMNRAFPDARELLKRYGLAATKSWGQNFLVSERVYRGIVDATVREDDDWIVEIGAGLGTLTMRLAQRVPEGKVIAVERDRDMIEVLSAELEHLENVEV